MHIEQVLVGARDGDAITQIAMNLQTVLDELAPSGIYARHVDPTVASAVQPIDLLPGRVGSSDIVILHVSIGDDIVWDLVGSLPARIWVVYHNITPAELFESEPAFAAMLAAGRAQLMELAPRIERLMTYTEYNVRDLRAMGFDQVEMIGTMIDPYRLIDVPADPRFGRELAVRSPGSCVLFVGQLLPHKRPDLLIGSLHLILAHHRTDVTLVLAGHHPVPSFAARVHSFAYHLGVADRVWITGGVSDGQLAELYRGADVLVAPSLHEGLCIPVIEAMAMSVPTVVASNGALPDTVADAGLVLDNDTPEHFAEAILMALEPQWHVDSVLRGRRRARELSLEQATPVTARAMAAWIDSVS